MFRAVLLVQSWLPGVGRVRSQAICAPSECLWFKLVYIPTTCVSSYQEVMPNSVLACRSIGYVGWGGANPDSADKHAMPMLWVALIFLCALTYSLVQG